MQVTAENHGNYRSTEGVSHAFIYVIDEKGWNLALNSAMSVANSQKVPCNICVYCHDFMPDRLNEIVGRFARAGADVSFHRLSAPEIDRRPVSPHIKKAALFKLYAVGKALEDFDRVAYLDNDILVFSELDIGSIDFEGKPVAAVVDMDLSETGFFRHKDWLTANMAMVDFEYFNSGVMTFDKKKWIGTKFFNEYLRALDEHDRQCRYKTECRLTDQCALNITFEAAWKKLDYNYNVQASAKFTHFWRHAVVRHYCGKRKFLPVAIFRNDGRDIRCLADVRAALGVSSKSHFQTIFEILYRFNAFRNRGNTVAVRRFINLYNDQRVVSV